MADGGKGDKQRPLSIPKEQFENNWDAIFKGKTMTTFTTQDRLEAERTPLTNEQIQEINRQLTENMTSIWRNAENPQPFFIEYARAIERAHGIGK